MNVTRKALSTLGGVFLAALLLVALAPRAARGVAAALVQVANTTSNPVPISDVAPLQPFQSSCNAFQASVVGDLSGVAECLITPPTGKRLVVQTVGITANIASSARVSNGFLVAQAGGSGAVGMPLIVPVIGTVGANATVAVTQNLRMYADQPLTCELNFFPLTSGYNMRCTVTGYLVDLP